MLTLLARVVSESDPSKLYAIHSNGEELTCNCPAWTRRTHRRDCRELDGRGSCDCRVRRNAIHPMAMFSSADQSYRTCKHVRQIEPRVRDAGGIRAAEVLVQQCGILLSEMTETTRSPTAMMRVMPRWREMRDRAAAELRAAHANAPSADNRRARGDGRQQTPEIRSSVPSSPHRRIVVRDDDE